MANTILVVDDEVSVRDLFKDAFNNAGYNVRSAEGAEAALAILKCTSSNGFRQNRSKIKRGFQLSYNPILCVRQASKSGSASFVKAWSFV